MFNKAILMGRLTHDPELRYTQTNVPVCSFSIAVDRTRKSPSGERQTDFFNCVTWNKQAQFVSQYFTKGMLAIVVGRIEPRQWQDKSGNNRISVEIQCDEVSFGETKKSREANMGMMDSGPANTAPGPNNANSASNAPGASGAPDADSYSSTPSAAPSFQIPSDDFSEFTDDDNGVPF